jgi:RNA polymerase subunit RPABC4/transcription elongation factor Spt4
VHLLVMANDTSSDPFGSIKDFFQSSTWHFIEYMFIFFFIVLWIACAYWIYKDSRRRVDDTVVIVVAVLTGVVFGPLGVLIYAILRPPEYLDDVRERELEMRTLEQRLAEDPRCPHCKARVREDFLICPNCMRRLRGVCPNCRRPAEPSWKVCPYCEEHLMAEPAGFELR